MNDLRTSALERLAAAAERIALALETIAKSPESAALAAAAERIAGRLAPEPGAVVGTPYVAEHLGCISVWIAELARRGDIPKGCVVPGTGNGKPWKFFRADIDKWLLSR
jgi:hypothetical protein